MAEIRFYHLERQSLDQALPALLSKALSGGHKIIVKTADEKEAERLNDALWTYHPNEFLPHGTKKDGSAEDQPIYITAEEENPNEAGVIILTGGVTSENLENYNLCCEVFDGRDQTTLKAARTRWKTYKDSETFELTYWQQTDKGWEKKA